MADSIILGGEPDEVSNAPHNAFHLAKESLWQVRKSWLLIPRHSKDVAQFLRDFYSSWHNVKRLAEFAEADGLDEATRALRTKVEEVVVPFAEVDWLLEFPAVVGGLHDRLVHHAAALCRAQAKVIEQCVDESLFADRVPDPYEIALVAIHEMHDSGKIKSVSSSAYHAMSEQAASDTPDAMNMHACEVFELAKRSLINIADTRPAAPLRSRTVMSWLHRFYGVWKLVELTASFANAPGLSQRLLDICAEIEAEARPYATLDWIHLFPRISAGNSEHLILFFSTLNHSYASALMIGPPLAGEPCTAFGLAMADFEDLYSKEMITEDKFNWCQRKLMHTKLDFNMEHFVLARIPVPGQPAPPCLELGKPTEVVLLQCLCMLKTLSAVVVPLVITAHDFHSAEATQ
ncbi:hypothetical protein BJY52DRAFT_1187550 [Lactarius psammicola]|nr:hypothetical protein BJY52DRAFT_1187550 [Lactarius psammicola]